MAAITATTTYLGDPSKRVLLQMTTGTSGDNSADTLTSPVVRAAAFRQRLVSVEVKYSAAPTHSGVSVEKDDAGGSTFDVTLATGAANGQSFLFIPDDEYFIKAGDAIRVNIPAGGGGITATCEITMEQYP